MHGTWQTTGGGNGPGAREVLAVVALVLAVSAAAGVAQAIASLVTVLLIVLAVLVVLVTAAVTALLVYRARRQQAPEHRHSIVRPPVVHQLAPEPQRAAIERPREVHFHFHGADPAEVAEVLRRHNES